MEQKILNEPLNSLMDQAKPNYYSIPLFNWNTLAQELSELNNKPEKFINVQSYHLSNQAFALKMKEISRPSILPAGTILLFDRKKPCYHSCFILAYDDQPRQFIFGRLLIEDEHLYIKSFPTEFDPMPIKKEQIIATLAQAQI